MERIYEAQNADRYFLQRPLYRLGCGHGAALGAGVTTYITINKHIIASNARHGTDEPAVRVARGKNAKPEYARDVEILGPCRLLTAQITAQNGKPLLKCNARIALATEAEVRVVR